MPTIKDIAQLAGVSHGTVSNVLNKKGNVSAQKISLVEAAAKELGFKLNSQAKELRAGLSKRVSLIVPKIDSQIYRDLYTGLNSVFRELDFELNIYFTNNINYYESELIERVISSNPRAVVIVSSFTKNTGIFNDDTKYVFVNRRVDNIPKNSVFVSFDFKQAGKDIAKRCIDDGHKHIAIFSGTNKYSNNRHFNNALTEILEDNGCTYKVFNSDESMELNVAFEIISSSEKFDAVIATSVEKAYNLKIAHSFFNSETMPEIYNVSSSSTFNDNVDNSYSLNYKLMGKKIGEYILNTDALEDAKCEIPEIVNDGFYYGNILKDKISHKNKNASQLKILMLSSPTSEAIRYLLPSFEQETGISVKLVEFPYDELYKQVTNQRVTRSYDIIRADMALLSDIGDKIYRELDLNSGVLNKIQKSFSKWITDEYYGLNGKTYVLPLDPSVQMLYYRRDLFEDALIKRNYYEKYNRHLEIPRTFEEYDEISQFFTKSFNKNSPTDYGSTLVCASSIVAACDYLPRLKELISAKKGQNLTDWKIDRDNIKKSLQEYVNSYKHSNQSTTFWWKKSTEEFAEGKTAMNIVFSNYASVMNNHAKSRIIGKVGFADIPGAEPLLGGGVIGISKDSSKYNESIQFFEWLYSEKISQIITHLGGYIINESMMENMDLQEIYPWMDIMKSSFKKGFRRKGGIVDFKSEEKLGESIRDAVFGVISVDEAVDDILESMKQM